jgi:hypothetical protein
MQQDEPATTAYSNECPTKTGVQLLMAGVESDAFDDNEHYAASSFQFAHVSSEGMMFHQEEQVLPKSWLDPVGQPVDS